MAAPERIELCPVTDGDRPFLRAVYASTRAEELALSGWDDDQQDAFITQQFDAQDHHYRQHYPGAEFHVVRVDGRPAGRLYVARWADEVRIMDVALLPEFRGRGIGTRLLRELLDEGAASGKRVSIHVEIFNRAQVLYRRLGFRPVQEIGVYRLMQWSQVNTAS